MSDDRPFGQPFQDLEFNYKYRWLSSHCNAQEEARNERKVAVIPSTSSSFSLKFRKAILEISLQEKMKIS